MAEQRLRGALKHDTPPTAPPYTGPATPAEYVAALKSRARQTTLAWNSFMTAYAETIRPAVRQASEMFAQVARHLREARLIDEEVKPARRPDRPAWQSTHGPARRRR